MECGTGGGGMTSDIRANAPLLPEGGSLDSPPAGPFPDIPEEKTEDQMKSQTT